MNACMYIHTCTVVAIAVTWVMSDALITRMDQSDTLSGCPDKCTCSEDLRIVNCKGRGLTQVPLDLPTPATVVYLGFNSLSRVPAAAFSLLVNLTRLDLNNNYIIKVESGALDGLTNVTSLSFTHNMLKTLPVQLFKDMSSLGTLYLGQNILEEIPDLSGAVNLTRVVMGNNKLKNFIFPLGFKDLSRLASINAANNPAITSLSGADLANLVRDQVKFLGLARCSIGAVAPGTLSGFSQLQTLNLGLNPMNMSSVRALVDSLKTSRVLQVLYLSSLITDHIPTDFFAALANTPIKQLLLENSTHVGVLENGTFTCCPYLEKLYLSESQISLVEPGAFDGLNKLQVLDLSSMTSLTAVPERLPPSLQTLTFKGDTNIKVIKNMAFKQLGRVSSLDLSDCRITQVQNNGFVGLFGLENLTLSGNLIPSLGVGALQPLKALVSLKLNNNKLVQITGDTSKLFQSQERLKVLDLSGNKLRTLPSKMDIFHPLGSLESFNLEGNDLGGLISRDLAGRMLQTMSKLLHLDLSNNDIADIPLTFFRGVKNATVIDLSANRVQSWQAGLFNRSQSPLVVDLSHNQVSLVNSSSVLGLPRGVAINLTGNPFACSCDLIWFREWLNSSAASLGVSFPGLQSYTCRTPASMAGRLLLQFDPEAIWQRCHPPPWLIIIICSTAGGFLVCVAIATVLYRRRWKMKLWCYYKRYGTRGKYRRLDAEDYDVMFSYDMSDRNWVLYELRARLDKREGGEFRTFCEEVDVPLGHVDIGPCADAMYHCKVILLVLSEDYFRNARHLFEMEIALISRAERSRPPSSIQPVLLCSEDEAVRHLPLCLHGNIDDDLIWSDDSARKEVFWSRLEQVLQGDHEIV